MMGNCSCRRGTTDEESLMLIPPRVFMAQVSSKCGGDPMRCFFRSSRVAQAVSIFTTILCTSYGSFFQLEWVKFHRKFDRKTPRWRKRWRIVVFTGSEYKCERCSLYMRHNHHLCMKLWKTLIKNRDSRSFSYVRSSKTSSWMKSQRN